MPDARLTFAQFLHCEPELALALDDLARAEGTSRAHQWRTAGRDHVARHAGRLATYRSAESEPECGQVLDGVGGWCIDCPAPDEARPVRLTEAYLVQLQCSSCHRGLFDVS